MENVIYTKCPICGSTEIAMEMKITDHSITKEEFELSRCGACNFLFSQNVPSEEKIGRYYKSENYISHSDTKKGLVNKIYHIVRNIMLSKKHQLIKRLSTGKELLDVGCGTGYFPDYMQQKGYKTLGIEVDEDARNYGIKKFGLNILPQKDLMNGSLQKQFDFITLWHVLEHLYDPKKYMNMFYNLLRDNGHLIIAVPNSGSLDAGYYKSHWAAYDVPRHLWHFTPKTLKKLAEDCGFKVVKMKSMPFDSVYNSMLSEQYKGNKLSLIFGGITGFRAILKGIMNTKNASSVIYVLKKA